MSKFPVTINGLDNLIKKLDKMPDIINKTVDAELQDGAHQISEAAISNAPGNTGNLRQGIGSDKIANLQYEVYSNAEYSAFVEFGTGAKVDIPSGLEEYAIQFKGAGQTGILSAKDAIFEWCRQRGIDPKAWYAIFISIMTNGVEPQPFFFRAKEMKEQTIIKNVKDALSDAI